MGKNKKLNLKEIIRILNFKEYTINSKILLGRNFAINAIFLVNQFFIHNGKTLKRVFITKFILALKIGEFFITRSQFSFLKKNKKITKR